MAKNTKKSTKNTGEATLAAATQIGAIAATIELPESVPAETVEALAVLAEEHNAAAPADLQVPVPEFTPVVAGSKAPAFKGVAERDAFGFGKGTASSILCALLDSEAGATKDQLLQALTNGDTTQSIVKAKKTTLSVFLSDVRREFGAYHASRAMLLESSEKTGAIRFNAERAAAVKQAIADGILSQLKDAKTQSQRKEIMTRFGF